MKILILFLLLGDCFSLDEIIAIDTPSRVLFVKTNDRIRDESTNNQIHLCIIDNEKSDRLYIGTKYGYWENGRIEISHKGIIVAKVKVPALLYTGVIVEVGDVISPDNIKDDSWCVSRASGIFK